MITHIIDGKKVESISGIIVKKEDAKDVYQVKEEMERDALYLR